MNEFWIVFLWGLSIFALLYGIWSAVPMLYGLPWVPSPRRKIRKALKMANLQEGETFYDLGAGDGRALILAAKEFGANAVGIEISPLHCLYAWISALLNGVGHKVRIRCRNFYRVSLADADVVFVYFTSSPIQKMEKKLREELHEGARVAAVSFDFLRWQPDSFDRRELIFVYRMPPKEGGLIAYLLKKESEPFILD